ncbi:GNAT family N-acetyltransferase [Caldalkalibacillus mannanilyticus]|uniref:GNAT family N-acetyltransferase n=1 Tax=Caldalkalibacillus mannanilyticus TaxID=1418 RepID=UPI000467FA07|nr:GNAT family protein [Caldalkalibacillus mannanilyticus]
MEIEEIYADLPIIETERLLLRKIKMEDAEDLYSYCSNEEVSKHVSWNTHRSLADSKGFIDFVLTQYEHNKVAPWAIEYKENGRLIGTIDFVWWQAQHKTAEIGYALSQDYWGKGLMSEAALEFVSFGFRKMDLVRIQARCFIENLGSARVMEKIGMTFEGIERKRMFTKGKHHDLKVYSILKEEFSKT